MIIYRKKKVIITVNHVVLKSLPNLEINLFLNNVTENTTPPKHPIKLYMICQIKLE